VDLITAAPKHQSRTVIYAEQLIRAPNKRRFVTGAVRPGRRLFMHWSHPGMTGRGSR